MFDKIKTFFTKSSRVSGVVMTGVPETVAPDLDYENFVKETYKKNVICFACAQEIAKAVFQVPWTVRRKNKDGKKEDIPNHPFNDVLQRANPDESFSFMLSSGAMYLLITGNCYFEKVGPDTGPNRNSIKEMYSLRPDRIEVIVDKDTGRKKQYKYTVNGQSVFFGVDSITGKSNLMQLKTFNPNDDWYGMGATEPAAMDIDANNSSSKWNKKLLDNDARPGMIYQVVGNLTDQQFDRLKKQLKEKAGAEHAGDSLIVEGAQGTQAAPYGYNPKDMDWLEGSRETARRIAISYGVPPMLLGIPGDNTYSNYKEARLAFWEETVIYWLNLFKKELSNFLFQDKEKDLFIDYNLDDIPALEPRRAEKWEKAGKASFLTENEKRELVDYDSIDGGDVILVPGTMVPLMGDDIDEYEEEVEEEQTETETELEEEFEDEDVNKMMMP